MNEALKEFAKQYGSFAFGVFTLLVIWMVIITPVLDRNSLDFETHRKLLEELNRTINNHQSVVIEQGRMSDNLRQAAAILERRLVEEREQTENVGPPNPNP